MREIITKVYTFDELSDSAKLNAIGNYANCDGEDCEYQQFIKKFEDEFTVDVRYEVGYPGSWCSVRVKKGCEYYPDFDEEQYDIEMNPIRISKWFLNNHPMLETKKGGEGNCPLTGSYTDAGLEDTMVEVFSFNHSYTSIMEVLKSIMDRTIAFWERDRDDCFTKDVFQDVCDCNSWEFYEDGTRV